MNLAEKIRSYVENTETRDAYHVHFKVTVHMPDKEPVIAFNAVEAKDNAEEIAIIRGRALGITERETRKLWPVETPTT